MRTNGKTRDIAVRRPVLGELAEVRSDVRDMLRDMWEMRWPMGLLRTPWPVTPEATVDMFDRDNSIVVKAEMPGIAPEQIDVSISDGELRITGERKEEKEVREEHYYRSERSYGKIFRALDLPEGCDTDAVKATIQDGVLEVVIPRKAQAAAKKIAVTAQSAS